MAVIPDEGEAWVVDKVQDLAPLTNAKMDVIAVGTGSTAEGETVTMASLTEVSEARVTGTLSQPNATTDRLVGTMVFTGSKTVTQVMRTNTTTKGDAGERCLFYALYTGIPVESGDEIQYTLDMVVS